MKNDQLEQFVIDNRAAFDKLEPGNALFAKKSTSTRKAIGMNSLGFWMRIAAAILLFSFGFLLNEMISHKSKYSGMTEKELIESYLTNDSLISAFNEIQFYYTSQIRTTREEIILLSNADQEISKELDDQLQEFKNIFDELRDDLKDQTNEADVIEAMIINYRLKLNLLEDLKRQLIKANQKEKEGIYETIKI